MPLLGDMLLPKTDNDDQFEDICCDVLNVIHQRKREDSFQRYGRRGQKQYGIDIYGKDTERNSGQEIPFYIVAQCKNYKDDRKKDFINAIATDIESVIQAQDNNSNEHIFPFRVSVMYIMTSLSRDTYLQEEFVKLAATVDFNIQIIFWDEIEHVICKDSGLYELYYPQLRMRKIPRILTSSIPTPVSLIGREKEISLLHSKMQEKNIIAISGNGGVGKTALAAHICNQIKNEENIHLAWISYSGNILESFLQLCLYQEEANDKKRIEKIKLWLQERRDNVWIIIDNVNSSLSNEEREFLNMIHQSIHIIITSRVSIEENFIYSYEISNLSEENEIELFYLYYKKDHERKRLEIVRQLLKDACSNALLIELLGRAANKEYGSLDDFINKFHNNAVVSKITRGFANNKMTMSDWVCNLYDIEELTLPQKRILQLLTIFPGNNEISGKVVEWARFETDDIDELVELGWISRSEYGFLVHDIVKLSFVQQNHINGNNSLDLLQYGSLIDKMIQIESYIQESIDYFERSRLLSAAISVCDYLLSGDAGRSMNVALFHNVAKVLMNHGKFLQAEKYFLAALNNVAHVNSLDRGELAQIYNNLGTLYDEVCCFDLSYKYFKDAIRIYEDIYGEKHWDTTMVYNNMGLMFEKKGDRLLAKEYFHKTLDLRTALYGDQHESLISVLINLGSLLRNEGDYSTAEKHLLRAEKLYTDHKCNDPVLFSSIKSNLASLYDDMGRYEEGLLAYETAKTSCIEYFGPDHFRVAIILNNMGTLYLTMRNNGAAKHCFESGLRICNDCFENTNDLVANLYNNMGQVFINEELYEEAEKYVREALHIRLKLFTRDSLPVAWLYGSMGKICYLQRKFDESDEFLQKALTVSSTPQTKDVILTSKIYYTMGDSYSFQKKYADAETCYFKALEIIVDVHGEEHDLIEELREKIDVVKDMQLQ